MSQFKSGQVIYLTTGEYSNYSIQCFAEVCKDFDSDEVQKFYLEQHPEESRYITDSKFILWLCQDGYMVELEGNELPVEYHFAEYSHFTEE